MSTHQQQFRKFAFYNAWFNERLYAQVAALPAAERSRDLGAFFGSLSGTLNHILLADRIWLARFADSPLRFESLAGAALIREFEGLDQVLYADFAQLAAARRETDAVIRAWVEELTPEVLAAPLRYRTSRGEWREHPAWEAAAHLFNHQTHHRGQVTTLLDQLGVDPGVTDFMVAAGLYEQQSA